jgi:hypothetical protein
VDAGSPALEQAPGVAMPADNTLGSDHDQVLAPVTAQSAGHNPEELVAGAETGSSPGWTGQDRKLMPKQEVFGDGEAADTRSLLEHHDARPGRLLHLNRGRDETAMPAC